MEFGRLVTQQDEWGCGIACVASLLAISYRDARARLERCKNAGINEKPEGLTLSPIYKVIRDAGYKVTKPYKARSYPIGTITLLTSSFGRYKGSGHYMLLTARGWMDPWYNINRRPRKAGYRSLLPKNTGVTAALTVKRSGSSRKSAARF